jgi:cytochrome oxidase Cu insertion factor (SCO1/SenC/PrrC family)
MQPSGLLPRTPVLIFAAVLLAAAMAMGAYSLLYTPSLIQSSSTGTALVGGPFTAVDHTGRTVTEKDFLGKYMLVFFGFTACPDVCPTELQVMTEALNQLGPSADRITPVLVSIDPERDTPDMLKDYISNFHPRMVGLTGSPQQIAMLAKTFRVYYAKVENKDNPGNYTMDHTSIVYLMGPDGKFLNHFSYSTDAAGLAESLRQVIRN